MKMQRLSPLSILLPICLLFSCQESDLVLPGFALVETKKLLTTIEPGTILSGTDSIPVSLVADIDEEKKPDAIEMRVVDNNPENFGAVVFKSKVEIPLLDTEVLPPVVLPSLPDGLFQVVFQMYRDGSMLKRETSLFFVSQIKPRIRGITVHPQTLVPGGDGILELITDLPAGKDAYIRWYAGNELLKTGLLSDGLRSILVTAPQSEGLYEYRVELFPTAPAQGVDYPFRSTVFAENRVVVSSKYTPDPSELRPDSNYAHIFHFQGSFSDSAPGNLDPEPIAAVGGRFFEHRANHVGYRVGPHASLRYARAMVPNWENEFTAEMVRLRIVPITVAPGVFMRSASADGDAGFELLLNKKNELSLRLWGNSLDYTLQSPVVLSTDIAADIQVGFGRSSSALQAVLWVGGGVVARGSIEYATQNPISATPDYTGTSRLGGSQSGMIFIADELGSLAGGHGFSNAYHLAMKNRLGKALLLAYDFSLPVIESGIETDGEFYFDKEAAMLSPGSSLTFEINERGSAISSFEIERAEAEKSRSLSLSISSGDAESVTLRFDGQIVQGSRSYAVPALENKVVSFQIQPGQKKWSISIDGKQYLTQIDMAAKLSLTIKNHEDSKSAAGIRRILATDSSIDSTPFEQ